VLDVFAMSKGVLFSTKSDPGGSYLIVLPPGTVQIWVEYQCERVSPTDTIILENGASLAHELSADLPDQP
jgi:hypothetical protein